MNLLFSFFEFFSILFLIKLLLLFLVLITKEKNFFSKYIPLKFNLRTNYIHEPFVILFIIISNTIRNGRMT